ncbi:hypothetical protein Glove_641g17 [Diversispora epigaea]|uniref:BTB domain-containing protein n=1 Tax=Diversispora epigaea TaxID=1348612 RepID=A0A397GAJ7_9GLOM|nr:hypothetical protein Glove_641g17 [Diversispora epigaea]
MILNFFDKLSRNLIELLNDKDDYNVIIIVKNEKSFTAHSNVLKCRSSWFCKELKNIIPNENNIKTITKPDISDEIFDIILEFIYSGIIDLENVETKFIFDLMVTVNELEIEELTKKLENHLIETKKSALISLLKRDDLQLEEVIIWEYVIKWGIAQNSALPANPKKWNKENFTTLKTTLQRCLPLIRYFHISGTDVAKKIKPYKKILDKQLWNDLNQYFMDPEQPVESIILPPRPNHSRTCLYISIPSGQAKSYAFKQENYNTPELEFFDSPFK